MHSRENATTNLVRINGNKKDLKPKDNILSSNLTLPAEKRHDPGRLFPPVPDSCELTIECGRYDFSASAIARAVEDADAHLLNLNVTTMAAALQDKVRVDLRVSHRNAGRVARSLERYGFDVVATHDGFDADSELTASRFRELMVHIDI